jgi:hypothetical protein
MKKDDKSSSAGTTDEQITKVDVQHVSQPIAKPNVSRSVAVEDVLAFAEYFRNNFDYYDCNANGRVYKWIDLSKRGQSAMTMKQIFDYWQSRSN